MSNNKHTPGPWLVFNIGCIECGVTSNVVGIYHDEQEAWRVRDICAHTLSWREGGQNSFGVYDLSTPMHDEYSEVINKATGDRP